MRKKLPSGGPANKTVPQDILKLEVTQGRCPAGHILPHRTNKGRCTPVYCAGSLAGSNSKQPTSEVGSETVKTPRVNNALRTAKAEILAQLDAKADETIDRLLPGESPEMLAARASAKAQKADELQKIGHQVGRFAAHAAIFKTPEGLTGADAEEFFKREAENLLPSIIVDLKRDLQIGDDTQRREARRDILDIVGKRKQENAPNMASVFVLVPPEGSKTMKLPWSKTKTINVSPQRAALPQGSKKPSGPQGDE